MNVKKHEIISLSFEKSCSYFVWIFRNFLVTRNAKRPLCSCSLSFYQVGPTVRVSGWFPLRYVMVHTNPRRTSYWRQVAKISRFRRGITTNWETIGSNLTLVRRASIGSNTMISLQLGSDPPLRQSSCQWQTDLVKKKNSSKAHLISYCYFHSSDTSYSRDLGRFIRPMYGLQAAIVVLSFSGGLLQGGAGLQRLIAVNRRMFLKKSHLGFF